VVYPNPIAEDFCYWMLNVSAQKLTGPQRVIVAAVYTAAVAQSSVTDQQWWNFNNFTAWRYPFFRVWYDLVQNDSSVTDISSIRFSGKLYFQPCTQLGFGSAPGWNGNMFWVPMPIGRSHAISSISVRCYATGAGKKISCALYSTDTAGKPGTLLQDLGEQDCTAVGVKTFTCPVNQNLISSDVQYFIGFQVNDAAPGFIYLTNPVPLCGTLDTMSEPKNSFWFLYLGVPSCRMKYLSSLNAIVVT